MTTTCTNCDQQSQRIAALEARVVEQAGALQAIAFWLPLVTYEHNKDGTVSLTEVVAMKKHAAYAIEQSPAKALANWQAVIARIMEQSAREALQDLIDDGTYELDANAREWIAVKMAALEDLPWEEAAEEALARARADLGVGRG